MSLTDSKRSKNYINKANENIKVASSSKPFSISNYNKWKKAYESGSNMRIPLKGTNITIKDLNLFLKLYKKKN